MRFREVPKPPPGWGCVSWKFNVVAEMMLPTWIHPLHAVGKGVVGDEVVASRSGVNEDAVGFDESRQGEGEE